VTAVPGSGESGVFGVDAHGPLTGRVLDYERAMKQLVPTIDAPDDWAPLAAFIAVDQFQRVGPFMEVQSWPDYAEMLTQWASSVDSFETTVRRISELPGLVYFEIEERHRRGDTVHVVNSLTIFEFDADARIRRLAVYLQQRPRTP
jgi:hypothetical protein